MSFDIKPDRRVGGIKAKRLLEIGNNQNVADKENPEDVSVILVISPWHNRIISVLKTILIRGGKNLSLAGVELYRRALSRIHGDLANRVVALVITDRADDCYAPGRGEKPLWQETILSCQEEYVTSFAKEIGKEIFPPYLTVITLFKSQRGRLSPHEIDKIEKEFNEFKQENEFKQINCFSELELQDTLDKEVISMVIKRQKQREHIKKYERTRAQKIAKAKNITRNAHQKQIFGHD
ncbi:MAG: hypothetical protein C4527_26865 [Candidatus Omnitrophota bacterium]|jgi:hypothetical protein|nr:MAG: hypothetical protein C4527_26865 [Candidatus Omnitrophota bacterium]